MTVVVLITTVNSIQFLPRTELAFTIIRNNHQRRDIPHRQILQKMPQQIINSNARIKLKSDAAQDMSHYMHSEG